MENFRPSLLARLLDYLPKEKLVSLVRFLEDVLRLSCQSAWKKAIDQAGTLFSKRLGSDWRKSEQESWDEFERKLTIEDAAILTTRLSRETHE